MKDYKLHFVGYRGGTKPVQNVVNGDAGHTYFVTVFIGKQLLQVKEFADRVTNQHVCRPRSYSFVI